jgi:hypothetical protein
VLDVGGGRRAQVLGAEADSGRDDGCRKDNGDGLADFARASDGLIPVTRAFFELGDTLPKPGGTC